MNNAVLKKAIVTVIGLAGVAALSSSLQAASFDCDKARIVAEKKICSSPELSALDDQLNTLYIEVRDFVSDKEALKKEQLSWLKQRRNGCSTNLCRKAAYEFRLDELSRIKKQMLTKEDSPIQKVSPKYRLKPHQNFDELYDNGVCQAMLDVINTIPYEKIYQDVFMEILNGRDGFQSIDWKLVEDGEEHFWSVVVEKTLMHERPESPEKRIAGLSGHKDKNGGFSYYTADALIYKYDNQVLQPILLFKGNKIEKNYSRPYWDFIVLDDSLNGPQKESYGQVRRLGITNAKQIFKYKGLYFNFNSSVKELMSVRDFEAKENSVCDYELIK